MQHDGMMSTSCRYNNCSEWKLATVLSISWTAAKLIVKHTTAAEQAGSVTHSLNSLLCLTGWGL